MPVLHLCPSIFMKILVLLLRFPYCGKARRQVPLLPQCLQKIPSHRFRNQYSIILTHCYFMPMFGFDIIMLSLVLGMVCGQLAPIRRDQNAAHRITINICMFDTITCSFLTKLLCIRTIYCYSFNFYHTFLN